MNGIRIAIVGTGVSAMTAAYLLAPHHQLTIFDKADYIGGHTHTHDVEVAGRSFAVDTGFIVFNDWTYPNFIKLLDKIGAGWRDSTMSFSVACDRTGLEYNGGSMLGLFAQKRNALSPKFWGLLRDIMRFNALAKRFAEHGDEAVTLSRFLAQHRFGPMFQRQYLVPIAASIWSADPRKLAQFPMKFMSQFFANHGMLNVWDRPTWRTVTGGSRAYMDKLTAPFRDRIRLREPVTAVRRYDDRVELDTPRELGQRFDHVILGCHSDQALAILGNDATADEAAALGGIPYQPNEAALHTDTRVLPKRRAAWAAWNYRNPVDADRPAILTYNMNTLQGLDCPETLCVTLNDTANLDPARVIKVIPYEHPVFTPGRNTAHALFDKINHVNRTSFCGAYWGFGFHEDGVVSALGAVKPFGVSL